MGDLTGEVAACPTEIPIDPISPQSRNQRGPGALHSTREGSGGETAYPW